MAPFFLSLSMIDGHNAGYTLPEEEKMKKPGILMLAERLTEQAANIDLETRVWAVMTMDVGKISKKYRASHLFPDGCSTLLLKKI
jgi:hypothetical protein